jgi:hypothetical protein
MPIGGTDLLVPGVGDRNTVGQVPCSGGAMKDAQDSSFVSPACHSTNLPGTEWLAELKPHHARRESSASLKFGPAATLAAKADLFIFQQIVPCQKVGYRHTEPQPSPAVLRTLMFASMGGPGRHRVTERQESIARVGLVETVSLPELTRTFQAVSGP